MIKELLTFREHKFDMIFHAHFEKHEGIMNNIVNNTDLIYTIEEDQIAKVRKKLENEDNDDNNANDKKTDKKEDTSDTDSKKISNDKDESKE